MKNISSKMILNTNSHPLSPRAVSKISSLNPIPLILNSINSVVPKTSSRNFTFKSKLRPSSKINHKKNDSQELPFSLIKTHSLSNLGLILSENKDKLDNKMLRRLIPFLTKSKRLKKLKLDLSGSQFKEAGFIKLSHSFENFFQIQEMNLDISQVQLSDFVTLAFSKSLKKLNFIISLSIKLSICFIHRNYGYVKLFEAVKQLHKLENFSISFLGENAIHKQDIVALAKALQHKKIKKMKLEVHFTQRSEGFGSKALKNSIETLAYLEEFDLNFLNCQLISHKHINHITQGLLGAPHLRKLNVNLRKTGVGAYDFSELIELVSKKNIEEFEILFPSFYFNAWGKDLGQKFQKASSLKRLKLDFEGCKEHYTSGICEIVAGLKGIALNSFELNLTSCVEMSDKDIILISETLSSMEKLSELSIYCQSCYRITEKSTSSLGSLIKKLKKVSFNFSTCSKLNDEAISGLVSCLDHSQMLKFCLKVNGCGFIGQNSLDLIQDCLTALPNLRELELDFSCCYLRSSTQEIIPLLEKKFSYLSRLIYNERVIF